MTDQGAHVIDPRHVIRTEAELRELVGAPRPAQQQKCLDALDDHGVRWIAASPFVVVSSIDADGRMDISPKGDPAGFVQVIDRTTIAIPDRPGNRRVDTFSNVLQNPRVAVIFLVPARGETLRVTGTAQLTTEPELLATMSVSGKEPRLAMVMAIEEVMFHCGKSVIRSHLWSPDQWPSIDHLASYAEILADQTSPDETLPEMETRFATWHQGNELY